jgi:hypothetical protein
MKTRETAGVVLLLLLQALSSIITPRSNAVPNACKHSEDNPLDLTAILRVVITVNSFFLVCFSARQKLSTICPREFSLRYREAGFGY